MANNNKYKDVDKESKRIAKKYNLDEKRVRKILRRLYDLKWVNPDYLLVNEFEEAINYMSPTEALELFEKEDLARLAARSLTIKYLKNKQTPLYTLAELKELTEELILLFKKNRQHLEITGFPKMKYIKSFWLDIHLNSLYYTKLPLIKNNIRSWLMSFSRMSLPDIMRQIEIGNVESIDIDYDWTKDEVKSRFIFSYVVKDFGYETPIGFFDLDLEANYPYINPDLEHAVCEYKDSPHIQRLEGVDLKKLEGLRGNLFDLKLDILNRLHYAVNNKSKYKLIDDCLNIIYKHLNIEDIYYLLKADKMYSYMLYGTKELPFPFEGSLHYHNAGLSDLLMVIGHYAKEIELSTMDEAKKALATLPDQKLPQSYYLAIGEPWQDDLDHYLYYFSRLVEREKEFWERYTQQINNVFSMKAIESNTLSIQQADIFSQLSIDPEKFRRLLQRMVDSGQIVFVDKNKVVINEPPSKVLSTQTSDYVFKLMGDKWDVVFEGKSTYLNKMIGATQIHLLLQYPEEKINSSFLYQYSISNVPIDPQKIKKMILSQQGLNIQSQGNQQLLDKEAIANYKRRINEIDSDLKRLNTNTDSKKIKDLEDEKRFLIDTLKGDTFKGKPKVFDSEDNRKRKAVYSSIKRVKESLKKKTSLPLLANHFEKNIKTGYSVSYKPEKEIPWKL